MGPGLGEFIQSPLTRRGIMPNLLISFGGINLLSMEDCASSVFLMSWTLVVSYLCFSFHIFDKPIFEKYVS